MNLEKYKIAGIILLHLLGLFSGYMLHDMWDKYDAPAVVNSSETFHSEILKPGKPDTSYKDISVQMKERIRKGNSGFEDGRGPGDIGGENSGTVDQGPVSTGGTAGRSEYSEISKSVVKKDGTISVYLKTYPGIDSVDIAATYQGKEREINQIDTLEIKDSAKSSTHESITVEAKDTWRLSAGTSKIFIEKNEFNKYIDLNYTRKVWFFYVTAGAGINNDLNMGLKDIKTHCKIEIGISL